jgi:hypothetical protein
VQLQDAALDLLEGQQVWRGGEEGERMKDGEEQ